MSHRYVVTAGIAAIAVALSGTVLGLAASARATAPSAAANVAAAARPVALTSAAKHRQYVVLDCGTARARPRSYTLACADDGLGLRGLHWASWQARLASGHGTFYENDCQPNCAAGHVHHYAAVVTLWQMADVPGHAGERQYTRMTVMFPGRHRPPVYHRKNGTLVASHPLTQTFRTF